MRTFHNRTAAITGAGSGIGRALALRLAAAGCHLSLADIDKAGLTETEELLADTGVRMSTHVVDVSSRTAIDSWAQETLQTHGGVNLVINNAGVSQSGTVNANQVEDYEWVLDINLWGVIHGTKAFLPHLLEHGDGHIVNISSVFGLQAQPGVSAYNTSKFAVRGFTESLRQELDILNRGVSATCVHPGGINTPIVRNGRNSASMSDLFGERYEQAQNMFDSMLLTSPERAAKTILAGVRRDAPRVLIGLDAHIIDIEQRLLPVGYQRVNRSVMRAALTATRVLPTRRKPTPPTLA